jgi:acyl-coenzyme A thioesterase 13
MNDGPAGFAPLFRSSPFLDALGPFYSRGTGQGLVIGLRIVTKHVNARGFAHGGVLSTVADIALGYALESAAEAASMVTASLSLDFAGSAKVGDWLESTVDIQKIGARLAYANAYLCVSERRIVRASAVFLVVEKQAAARR